MPKIRSGSPNAKPIPESRPIGATINDETQIIPIKVRIKSKPDINLLFQLMIKPTMKITNRNLLTICSKSYGLYGTKSLTGFPSFDGMKLRTKKQRYSNP